MPNVDIPEFFAQTRKEWRHWLQANHDKSKGVWLVTVKLSQGGTISYEDMVEEALCFGWIDSVGGKVDEIKTKLYFAPRKPKSNWSRPNKERVEKLLAQNLIHSSGMKMIELAKQTGTWDALNDVENLVIPPDLAAALKAHHPADKNFEAFPRSIRRGILEWILNAKRPETRAARIQNTAELAKENKRANQYEKK